MNLDVLRVSRCKYKLQRHVRNHCHNFYHLLYLTGGNGTLRVDGQTYGAAENDFYVIPPGVFHEIQSDPEQPLRSLELKFVTKDGELIRQLEKLPLRFNNRRSQVRAMLELLVEEALHKRPFYKEMITTRSVELLLHLFRMFAERSEAAAGEPQIVREINAAGNDLADRVLKYIHDRYTEPISLGSLAKTFNISHNYLCRIFSKKFDISPIQYTNNLRIQKVKELLASTDLSITEISRLAGFSSIHYLSRYFTLKEKMSPLEYRQRVKDNVHITVEEKYRIVDHQAENVL